MKVLLNYKSDTNPIIQTIIDIFGLVWQNKETVQFLWLTQWKETLPTMAKLVHADELKKKTIKVDSYFQTKVSCSTIE
jgi:hypothetical protein